MRLRCDLPPALKYQAVIIENAARAAGLDFFDVVFELLDAKDVNGVAAYGGFPVRHPSWRFGMEYERLEKGRQWGLSKIYELVINNDPTYAYLVRSNSLMEQKLVMAHVYGHADFFKHNLWFAPTERKMLDVMANHSTRVRRYVDAFGLEEVEQFLDRVLSLDTLIDPFLPRREQGHAPEARSTYTPPSQRALRMLDSLSSPPLAAPPKDGASVAASELAVEPRRARLPSYDVLGFLEDSAPLEAWQRDLVHLARAEAYYFAPQRMTKIMNEGWASYWHSKLLTGGILEPSEVLDFADCHSAATYAAPGQLNPYKLGLALFRYAERRGEDLFQLRRVHNDVSLVHKLVDEEFALEFLQPLLPKPQAGEAQAAPDWRALKSGLLQQLAWGGLPQIELVECDADGRGELLFVHHHDGRDLQLARAQDTLLNVAALWKRPVQLLTLLEKQGKKLLAKGAEVSVLDSPEAEARCGAGDGDPRRPVRREAS
ncbi:MAG: SpoVR family protein [Planctomycetes bacterium]|nr:SpoVR family protein [Planctomycetota bacterium]